MELKLGFQKFVISLDKKKYVKKREANLNASVKMKALDERGKGRKGKWKEIMKC
jgi:hypothetical protein